jgi:hypothetical protein
MAPKNPCIICAKNVTNQGKDGSIACCVCHRWNHNSCLDLHPEAIKYFNKMWKDKGHHFYSCEGCSLAYHELNMKVAEVAEKLKVLSTDVAANTESNKTTNTRVDQVVLDVDQVKKDVKASKDSIVKETTRAWSSELREREQMKNNIVIYGLTELSHTVKAGMMRKNHDHKELETMLTEIGVPVDLSEETKFVIRLGELTETVDEKPRPLKIGLRSRSTREHIFDNARKLPKTRFKEISVVLDLTSLQREEDSELRDQADQLNRDLTEDESLNWQYRCVGLRGERVIRKLKVNPLREAGGRGRGGRDAPTRGASRPPPSRPAFRPQHHRFQPHHAADQPRHAAQPRLADQPRPADPPRPLMRNSPTRSSSDSVEEGMNSDQTTSNRSDKRLRSPTPVESESDLESTQSSPGYSGTSRREKRSKKAKNQNH